MKTFENAGHSYTEAGHYEPKEEKVTTDTALRQLLALHHREIAGDFSITTREWAEAIKNAEDTIKKDNDEKL